MLLRLTQGQSSKCLRSSCFIRYKTLYYRLVSLYLIKHSRLFIKQYII